MNIESNDGQEFFNRISDVLKAIADPVRLRILHELQGGEFCVSDLVSRINGSQANISKHLAVLRRVGFVTCRRSGHNIYYKIQDESVFQICASVSRIIENRLECERDLLTASRRKYERNSEKSD